MSVKKVSVVEFSGFHMVYPGQPMLEKRHKNKSVSVIRWGDIAPDNSYKPGKWKITIEFQGK